MRTLAPRLPCLILGTALLACAPRPTATPAQPVTPARPALPVSPSPRLSETPPLAAPPFSEGEINNDDVIRPTSSPWAGYEPPKPTKGSDCQAKEGLPDRACTPGAIMHISLDEICHSHTEPRRTVSSKLHKAAFTNYGFDYPQPHGAFEVDHLIPLELGGDNVIANLWAEAASPKPGFHEKDRVEHYLHRQVCNHSMSLAEAQREIAIDWLVVWRKIGGPRERRR